MIETKFYRMPYDCNIDQNHYFPKYTANESILSWTSITLNLYLDCLVKISAKRNTHSDLALLEDVVVLSEEEVEILFNQKTGLSKTFVEINQVLRTSFEGEG